MGKLADELRKKFRSPRDAVRKLGIDENLIAPENIMPKLTKFGATAMELVAHALGPSLARDAKVDLLPVFEGVTAKTFDKGKVKIALDAATKGKLAKDEEPQGVTGMLDRIEHMVSPNVGDASVSEAQHNAMGAAAGGNSNLDIPQSVGKEFMRADKSKFDALPSFLQSKGLSEDDIRQVMDAFPKAATDAAPPPPAETDEEKRKREEAAKAATDAAVETARKEEQQKAADAAKGMVTKDEMSTAIKTAVEMERSRITDLAKARDAVRPIFGEIAMSFDTADQVYRHVAKAKGVNNADTIASDALPEIIKLLPRAGAAPRREEAPTIAKDAAQSEAFTSLYGEGAARLCGLTD